MLETGVAIFFTVFSVFAILIGMGGLAIVLSQWIAADIFGKPLKINGVEGPIDWPQRGFILRFAATFGCLAAAGVWLFSADWVAPAYVRLLTSIPVWAYGLFLLLNWLLVTGLLNRSAGWPEIMRSFPRPTGAPLSTLKLRWAVMGKGVIFRNAITIKAYDAGVAIAQSRLFGPFTRAALVPWDQVKVDAAEGLAPDLIRLEFGTLEDAALVLSLESWEVLERHRPTGA